MAAPNYLLGKGEELTSEHDYTSGGGTKIHPYTLDEQKLEIGKRAAAVVKQLKALPAEACPNDEAVAVLTLNPAYLSKSSFPNKLLDAAGLRPIGSRQKITTPRKIASSDTSKRPQPAETAEIFVAGKRDRFEALSKAIPSIGPNSPLADDFIKIEDLRVPKPAEKIQPARSKEKLPLMEFVLHAGGADTADGMRDAFKTYLATLGIKVDLEKRIDAGQLSFIAVRVPRDKMTDAVKFSFLRTSRDMPRLRQFRPAKANSLLNLAFACSLPSGDPIDPTISAAVFDGGIPKVAALDKWVILDESAEGLAAAVPRFQRHGLGVTSALLFGSLPEGRMAPQPYCKVHHFRVLDVNTANDPQDQLYPVLRRIVAILENKEGKYPKFGYAACSIGPDIPLQDDEVHPWTAKLDELFSDGTTLACIAGGNTGEADSVLGYDRVQPPADCVNALAVGACDSQGNTWKRATYSSVGYGRSPGFIKPDGLAFGGTEVEPFWVLEYGTQLSAYGESGTSFAAPLTLRGGIGVSAQMGPALSPLAIRALLVHKCQRSPHSQFHKQKEVGWGRFCTDVDELVQCVASGATVVYQGFLNPKKVLRAEIPMPVMQIVGEVTISATICFATEVDPQDPVNYTRSSVVPRFRPDKNNIPDDANTAESEQFFGIRRLMREAALRREAGKWETTIHKTKTFETGLGLRKPVFDLHYSPREGGQNAKKAEPILYAMIVSVSSPDVPDMYDHVWRKYRHKLQQLRPRFRVIANP